MGEGGLEQQKKRTETGKRMEKAEELTDIAKDNFAKDASLFEKPPSASGTGRQHSPRSA